MKVTQLKFGFSLLSLLMVWNSLFSFNWNKEIPIDTAQLEKALSGHFYFEKNVGQFPESAQYIGRDGQAFYLFEPEGVSVLVEGAEISYCFIMKNIELRRDSPLSYLMIKREKLIGTCSYFSKSKYLLV